MPRFERASELYVMNLIEKYKNMRVIREPVFLLYFVFLEIHETLQYVFASLV